jgi:uncharacterized membrane protein
MGLLTIGLILWVLAHVFKRVMPQARAALNQRLGAGAARGVFALLIVASVVLMIIGYKNAPINAQYDPVSGAGHINNVLMLVAVFLFGMSASTGRIGSSMRHPMLMSVIVWAVAHLLVNGDTASLILFGGMAIWAVFQIVLINATEGPWQKPVAGPVKKDIILFVITAVAFAVMAGIHIALGYNPFGVI